MQFTFNEDELRVIGKHTQFGIYGGEDTEAVSYNYPITPKENMIRMLRGEKPLWVPNQTGNGRCAGKEFWGKGLVWN